MCTDSGRGLALADIRSWLGHDIPAKLVVCVAADFVRECVCTYLHVCMRLVCILQCTRV